MRRVRMNNTYGRHVRYSEIFKRSFVLMALVFLFWAVFMKVFFLPAIHNTSQPVPLWITAIKNYVLIVFKFWHIFSLQMDLPKIWNAVEVFLWGWIGIAFLIYSVVMRGKVWSIATAAGVLFTSFSITDAAEIETGAWWSPIWLLVAKTLIIACLLTTYFLYKKIANTVPRK